MKAGRTSLTAEWVAMIRAVYSASEAYAQDPVAEAILSRPLQRPTRLLRAIVTKAPALLRLGSLVGIGLPEGVALRTLRLDDLVHKAVDDGATQLLLLGAGLDVRAHRLADLRGVTVYEVDHPDTQRVKKRRLGDRAPLAREVRYVAVDFEKQDLGTELLAAGFATSEKTAVVWEGVTMYLRPEARRGTLAVLGKLLAPGSMVGITYIRPEIVGGLFRRLQAKPLALIGEPLIGAIGSDELAAELQEAGFEVYEDDAARGWARRYTDSSGPAEWERIVVAMR